MRQKRPQSLHLPAHIITHLGLGLLGLSCALAATPAPNDIDYREQSMVAVAETATDVGGGADTAADDEAPDVTVTAELATPFR